MPKKFTSCVKQVQKKIDKGEIPKEYGKGKKSSAYAICRKSTGYKGTTHERKRK
jgi:hypothetical protein